MPTDLRLALLVRDRMIKIANDPDLNQQAKLFAFCLLAFIVGNPESGTRSEKRSWANIGDMMRPHTSTDEAIRTVRYVIADDIPRYEVPYHRRGCMVPKTRGPNTGQPCGKGATSWVDTDPLTGEMTHICLCKNHITNADRERHRQRFKEWEANGKPSPPANRGGVLARHFKANWAKLYEWANPNREPLPDGKPPTPPKPKLTLIQGGAL